MPDIRLQALPKQPNYRSVSCSWGGVHIQPVRPVREDAVVHMLVEPVVKIMRACLSMINRLANRHAGQMLNSEGNPFVLSLEGFRLFQRPQRIVP